MVTISSIQIELELRELRKKLFCRDLIKYIFYDGDEPCTENYDSLISFERNYKIKFYNKS